LNPTERDPGFIALNNLREERKEMMFNYIPTHEVPYGREVCEIVSGSHIQQHEFGRGK